MLLRLFYKANLTDDQKAQLKSILENHRTALRDLRSQLQANREAMADRLLGPSPGTALLTADNPQLQSLAQQASDLRGQIAQHWLQAIVEMRNILTPDQLTKVEGLKNQLRSLHYEMRSLLEN